jgi:hypothetical protein
MSVLQYLILRLTHLEASRHAQVDDPLRLAQYGASGCGADAPFGKLKAGFVRNPGCCRGSLRWPGCGSRTRWSGLSAFFGPWCPRDRVSFQIEDNVLSDTSNPTNAAALKHSSYF